MKITVNNISIILRYILKYHTLHASLCKSFFLEHFEKYISNIVFFIKEESWWN